MKWWELRAKMFETSFTSLIFALPHLSPKNKPYGLFFEGGGRWRGEDEDVMMHLSGHFWKINQNKTLLSVTWKQSSFMTEQQECGCSSFGIGYQVRHTLSSIESFVQEVPNEEDEDLTGILLIRRGGQQSLCGVIRAGYNSHTAQEWVLGEGRGEFQQS